MFPRARHQTPVDLETRNQPQFQLAASPRLSNRVRTHALTCPPPVGSTLHSPQNVVNHCTPYAVNNHTPMAPTIASNGTSILCDETEMFTMSAGDSGREVAADHNSAFRSELTDLLGARLLSIGIGLPLISDDVTRLDLTIRVGRGSSFFLPAELDESGLCGGKIQMPQTTQSYVR